ncbi:hypothetical protein ACFYYR_01640 [Streptomyces sp. NPDC001922]|uniref:hypothetical protein n=1 Tax=Streptomyces sp. NPDC001922 TaxID=3364624 RepID=UPI0036ABB570
MERSTDFTFGIPWIMNFFHQDWTLDAASEPEAVSNQFVEELHPASVLLVRRDARSLLKGLPAKHITVLWEACAQNGEYFFRHDRVPDGAEWMRQVIQVCEDWLSHRPDTPTLTGPDLDEGRGLADEVLSTVTEFNGILDQKVTAALAECVRGCTPDLAFRLLLQALPVKSAAMFPDAVNVSEAQYARLEALGRAFHYGEFVVGDVKHLTE